MKGIQTGSENNWGDNVPTRQLMPLSKASNASNGLCLTVSLSPPGPSKHHRLLPRLVVVVRSLMPPPCCEDNTYVFKHGEVKPVPN